MFDGFPPEALAFYEGLSADNSKGFWQEHRDTYERCVREPMEELVLELNEEFGAGKVFRPYRDVRFSKDKSPYKTACGALLAPDGVPGGGHYVEISAGGLTVGGGIWHVEAPALARIRKAIDDEKRGAELERIAAALDKEGMPLHEPELKTAPRGFTRDHPRIDLLRRKRFAALARHEPGPWLHSRKALDRIVERWRATRPLQDWLAQATR